MFRGKLLVRNFATCKNKLKPSVFAFDNASFSCLTFQRFLVNSRDDSNGFEKLNIVPKIPLFQSNERSLSKFSDAKCWNCEKYLKVKNYVCIECGALQPPKKNLNYFELFGVSQKFDVNVEVLSEKFKNLQKNFHPDKFVGKTKAEQEFSEAYSRLVNKAYATLKDPLQRGWYLLSLLKYPDCNLPLDQEFLKIMLTKNEKLECILNENGIETFRNELRREVEEHLETVKLSFQTNNLHEAKIILSKLSYLESVDKRAKEKIEKFQENKKS